MERGDVVSLAVVVRVEVAVEDAADARVVQRGERLRGPRRGVAPGSPAVDGRRSRTAGILL